MLEFLILGYRIEVSANTMNFTKVDFNKRAVIRFHKNPIKEET